METLRQKFYEKYTFIQIKTIRDFINTVDWSNRFIGIKGSRGVGKTTLLLQYIKKNYKADNKVLYASLDNFYFSVNRLYDLADSFYKKGGKLLAIDEVHRYANWATELKNIYDDMPDLKVVFTGSSLLHLNKAKADLSRRVVMYKMPGLSFREFLKFETERDFPIYSLDDIINNHIELAIGVMQKLKPLAYFEDYLNYGYYPFYLENKKSFHQKLNETLLTVLEIDIPQFESIQTSGIIYLKKLLKIISRSVPFKPNMNSLSSRSGISLNTMKTYLKYLSDAKLLSLLYFPDKGINSLNKPEKIYLENTNLIYNLADNLPDIGNIRETFFFNQISNSDNINASKQSDFKVNNQYTFEIGGKNKQQKQIHNIKNSFIVKDNIEIGTDNIIPLWLFGFLY
ncbi:MAG: ATP-binding protein [Bacteroidales bacterium]|nr:ATP-binding protein [Bacteroidales bacterium]MBN2756557.1 ATP-binding protein [Bacteroidales bacterium]